MTLKQRHLRILCLICLFIALVLYGTLYFRHVRNILFSSFIPPAWSEIETVDLIQIHYIEREVPKCAHEKIVCAQVRKTGIKKETIDITKLISYDSARDKEIQKIVASRGHGNFLPRLRTESKLDIMYIYFVMANALKEAGVVPFLVAGSILGMVKHGGFVPWDDDIDVSISVEQCHTARLALSCIHGFELFNQHPLHWKFKYADKTFPFTDIFIHDSDEKYVWARTWYTRSTYIYPTKYVFPLTNYSFEGHMLPFPRDSLKIAKRIYNYDLCVAFPGHFTKNTSLTRLYPKAFSMTHVECHKLNYLYNMKYLRSE